ncbi:MAG: serine/threonine protein phosphatase [Opitutaceae bacterium]|nr:serine/threonine protein phosphatase [Verrucomicrobiales bacterium]
MNRARHLIVSLLFVLSLSGGTVRGAEAPPTFAEWRAACAKLPTNRSLAGRMPPKALLPLQTFDELERVLDGFLAVATNGPLANPTNWVGTVPARHTFLNTQRGWFAPPQIPFEPFAQKLVLPANARVFLEGDLHGDVHSLLAVLGRLNERKLLDGFQIIDPDLHVIFLGDYTDRGLYGVEVLYTLLRFKLANPDRVHFARGNHEDLGLVSRYGFLAEGQAKYGRAFNAAKILRAYDFLPVVIYLGAGSDFAQVNHGGMEPGYSPGGLLTAEGSLRFQLLGPLQQAAYLKQHPEWLTNDTASLAEAREHYRDFIPTSPTLPSVIGFMWNDFTVFGDEPAFTRNPDRAFVYGRTAVQHILKTVSTDRAKVRTVIRAHQHSGIPNPLMRRLVASHGLFRHWQEPTSPNAALESASLLATKVERSETRALPDGSVWTFNVSPDSVYGTGCDFSFVTYGILQLGEQFSDWRMAVESLTVPKLERFANDE